MWFSLLQIVQLIFLTTKHCLMISLFKMSLQIFNLIFLLSLYDCFIKSLFLPKVFILVVVLFLFAQTSLIKCVLKKKKMEKELSDMLTDHAQNILVFPEAVFKRHWGGKKNPDNPCSSSQPQLGCEPPKAATQNLAARGAVCRHVTRPCRSQPHLVGRREVIWRLRWLSWSGMALAAVESPGSSDSVNRPHNQR